MKLEVTNLSKTFDKNVVLDNLSFTLDSGNIYVLLGRNGCGKTTLFNCISGEIKPDMGMFLLDGKPITASDIGYVYASPLLPEFLTGMEFLSFFLDIHKDKGLHRNDIHDYFDRIQFSQEDRYKLIKEYSFGMRNKLQMICILMLKPKVLFLDEPLTSFDVVSSIEIKELLIELKDSCIMILSTHIMQIARDIGDQALILHKGNIQSVSSEKLHDASFESSLLEILRDAHE